MAATLYMLLIGDSTFGNDGSLRFPVTMFVVKKETEVDYKVEMKVTPGKPPSHVRILSIGGPMWWNDGKTRHHSRNLKI